MDQTIAVDSPDGRRIVDQVVESNEVEEAIESAARAFLSSGQVSLAGNRKALRISMEPMSVFREYMAHFSLAQADCHFSPALVENLESHWIRKRARS
jgi:thioesterase DpgC